ncbi:hypothetical protein EUGRSUZ_G02417 [Eucalyptus grandis]|uniref:Uncharacterized protein n=2 Tax=Eucalyptus grandis TaxID=71139 RepID=A0A059BF61_EUCGR|nr:hypothetical protein EUGRSUZ_G02417 [Eucalyptus grandis]
MQSQKRDIETAHATTQILRFTLVAVATTSCAGRGSRTLCSSRSRPGRCACPSQELSWSFFRWTRTSRPSDSPRPCQWPRSPSRRSLPQPW